MNDTTKHLNQYIDVLQEQNDDRRLEVIDLRHALEATQQEYEMVNKENKRMHETLVKANDAIASQRTKMIDLAKTLEEQKERNSILETIIYEYIDDKPEFKPGKEIHLSKGRVMQLLATILIKRRK